MELIKSAEQTNHPFSMEEYFNTMERIIKDILSRPENEVITYDILDSEKTMRNKLIILKEKQRQMKIGEIWQETIGNYDKFVNLRTGHYSGLDILSDERKIIIELKNRTNTDNYSSKKTHYDKLSKFKRENPEYTCIYANINDSTQKRTFNRSHKKIMHNQIEIEHWVGYEFLKFIFAEKVDDIITFLKTTIDKYT